MNKDCIQVLCCIYYRIKKRVFKGDFKMLHFGSELLVYFCNASLICYEIMI